ncbi:MAG: DUF4249 family protein [Saprospiraceae bacterium]
MGVVRLGLRPDCDGFVKGNRTTRPKGAVVARLLRRDSEPKRVATQREKEDASTKNPSCTRWSLLMFWCMLCCTACEKTDADTYDFQYLGNQLVVYAWITPTGVQAFVGKTQNLNEGVSRSDFERDTVGGAEVYLLSSEGTRIGNLTYTGAGYYRLGIDLEPGESYGVTVDKVGFPSVKSDWVELPQLAFDGYLSPVEDGPYLDTWYTYLTLTDELGTRNIYTVQVFDELRDSLPFTSVSVLQQPASTYQHSNVWLDVEEGYGQQCGLYATAMPDDCFRDAAITLPVLIDFSGESLGTSDVFLEVSAVSNGYDEYQRSLVRPEIVIEYIFDSPSIVVNNVSGGIGFVAAKNSRLLPLIR